MNIIVLKKHLNNRKTFLENECETYHRKEISLLHFYLEELNKEDMTFQKEVENFVDKIPVGYYGTKWDRNKCKDLYLR